MAQILRRPTWRFKLSLEFLIKWLVSPFQSLWGMHPPGHSNEQRDETILVSSGKKFFFGLTVFQNAIVFLRKNQRPTSVG